MTSLPHPAAAYYPPHSQANPIDLTLDDDDDDLHSTERMSKRICPSSRSFNASCSYATASTPSSAYSRQSPSGLSPAMSHSTLAPPDAPPTSSPSHSSHSGYGAPRSHDHYESPSPNAPRFQGPSSSAAFFRSRQAPPSANPLDPHPPMQASSNGASPSSAAARQIIDLTGSPSPPPSARSSQPPQPCAPPPQAMGNLPPDLPPKTPVCIGVLAATALVLYPISYLSPSDTGGQECDWAPVRLQYEHNDNKASGSTETIHIRPPSMKGTNGEVIPGETFAVVEQKVATHLGPMLGKGLIRLDAKIRRTNRPLPILQLQLLVFTPKGNIPVVSHYLATNSLYLDHPTHPTDVQHASSQYYHNPHNPPPGGHAPRTAVINRPGYLGPSHSFSKWSAPAVAGRSIEVQRNQVDELFKSLKSGDEIDEANTPPDVATKMYPHQLKALTFLLAREQETDDKCRRQTSLWQERVNPLSHQRSWVNIVTQAEEFTKPWEAKSAILADDMGLGKTITCVSLMAATLQAAREFGESPLPPPPPALAPSTHGDAPLTASHFQGSVWGIPPLSIEPHASSSSSKKNKAAQKEQDRAEAQYTRACRIKMKSRATLIICPLSTVVNWEDQFREHWRGEVTVYGGAAAGANSSPSCSVPQQATLTALSTPTGSQLDIKAEEKKPASGRVRDGTPLRVYVYHGNARRLDPSFLADFDAVITTYSTLASEFSKQTKSLETADDDDDDEGNGSEGIMEVDASGKGKKKQKKRKKFSCTPGAEVTSPLQSVHWFRVVLDEAHCIKETNTVGCRASCDLIADRRLCLTGTPVQNKLDDVYALIKFLRLTPFDDKNTWNEFIGTPVKYAQPLGVARLQTIMKCITLRRTKESRAEDGKKILYLPPRHDELRLLKFDAEEQAIYDQFFNESKAEFQSLSHKNEVMKNYVGILQKILRLRQICDHFELVFNKGLGLPGETTSYEDVVAAITREGLDVQRAAVVFNLLKEAGTTQCVECSCELSPPMDAGNEGMNEDDAPTGPAKRGRKPKAAASSSRVSTRQNSPNHPQPVLTRCQHLYCADCFRSSTFPGWPKVAPDTHRCCSVCQQALAPSDAVLVNLDCTLLDSLTAGGKKKPVKKEKRQKGIAPENFHPSTKVRALLGDLIQFSRVNPYSPNYDPNSVEVQMVDGDGNKLDDGITKTVVFSQWTSMLDKVEDALEIANIHYERLDGTMKRDERTKAMEALKHDPSCEVLLVSLKAGGVGLNLTAAQRVYLMDPYWNPAVENQAVDRIHRLGQTRPVTTIKLIIENTIEARLLAVQKKKSELAKLTLGPPLSKSDLQARRLEELQQLFAS
ncbi:SNF2 family N-terminal domain-containing protein [Epithele typhae]|uniref:SNF2 family N-terminal domain-containing protein n=1 Tax=Epithele typhae TaxID=378194 RepID=UPI002008DB2C|nr:SNF2 family N-terminal domain-containing protein [Epithele typhae]KAH9944198.1 SNF2 family N-terminal domain-containing protein [Epithele typhae]